MEKSWRMIAGFGTVIAVCVVTLNGCRLISGLKSKAAMDEVSNSSYMQDEDEKNIEDGYVLAEQTGILSEDWHDFTIQLNSIVIKLPCSMNYLEGAGLKMDTSFMASDTFVNRGNRETVYFRNDYGDAIMVTFMNPDRIPRELNECLVTGIAVSKYDLKGGKLSITFPGGVHMGSEKSTALIAYGSRYELYESETVHMYTWHDLDSYYRNCEIDYDAKTLKTNCMIINY